MRPFFTLQIFAASSLAAIFGLAGCTNKEDVEPTGNCDTVVTVRLCPGNTSFCPTEHTTLELADGYRLQPTGAVWEAYEPRQREGQVLRIGYKRVICNDIIGADCIDQAEVSCLEENWNWCGTPPR